MPTIDHNFTQRCLGAPLTCVVAPLSRHSPQLCFLALLFTAFFRQNAIGLIYYFWLTITMRVPKSKLVVIWRPWLLSLAILFIGQYASAVAIPDSWHYSWDFPMDYTDGLRRWMYLPPLSPTNSTGGGDQYVPPISEWNEPATWREYSVSIQFLSSVALCLLICMLFEVFFDYLRLLALNCHVLTNHMSSHMQVLGADFCVFLTASWQMAVFSLAYRRHPTQTQLWDFTQYPRNLIANFKVN